mmetsp:Transcript_32015/g.81366  ORF Transcript_32015/g.81366 Transcript_32015/m.81366 type:complete len:210 (-) Transcript_32015:64-693(-)
MYTWMGGPTQRTGPNPSSSITAAGSSLRMERCTTVMALAEGEAANRRPTASMASVGKPSQAAYTCVAGSRELSCSAPMQMSLGSADCCRVTPSAASRLEVCWMKGTAFWHLTASSSTPYVFFTPCSSTACSSGLPRPAPISTSTLSGPMPACSAIAPMMAHVPACVMEPYMPIRPSPPPTLFSALRNAEYNASSSFFIVPILPFKFRCW